MTSLFPLSLSEILLVIIATTGLGCIISGRLRPDLAALLVLVTLGVTRVISPQEAFSGFSNSAVITIIGLSVITAALEQTGAVRWVAHHLAGLSGKSETRMIAVFMIAGALLSLVMNNIAAGAILLPAAVRVARQAQIPASKILMPLSFGTLLGGMATLFTTSNIILSGNLIAQGQRGLTMADFLVSGGPMVITGLLYMLFIGRRLLPARETAALTTVGVVDLRSIYQLDQRLWEVRLPPDAQIVGTTLAEANISALTGTTVIAIWRGHTAIFHPTPTEQLRGEDILLVLGREDRVTQLEQFGCIIGRNSTPGHHLNLPIELAEVIVGPRAPFTGQTLQQLRFRTKFGLTVVSLWREGRSYRTNVGTIPLAAGDALLITGPLDRIQQLAEEPGFIVLHTQPAEQLVGRQAVIAGVITLVVLLAATTGWIATGEAMLAGAAALIISGCITMDDAYRAIEWRVITMIAGLLPIGIALTETGLGAKIGTLLTSKLVVYGPMALLTGLFLTTVLMTQLVGGQVTPLIIGPIAISAALNAHVNPQAIAVAVAIGCSTAFLTPIAHPVSLMMGPGNYRSGDFLRVGLGLTVVCLLTLLIVMPLVWRLNSITP
ncbi:SLC13 family permease [Roseiflexus castenholzii]|uniref:TrkA-C domain protein n=1 Tax=Roseiflexus castenholzii (strain DSM 13941 / HLO8) TaxID=383372 RepID=A7NMA0_ROSCS|nr:SLC13 family permease [Roseiflexus castenholzii]ABU58662.1 TrkA-C domain protein [Roseiflexus castenholzii DSM 13941]